MKFDLYDFSYVDLWLILGCMFLFVKLYFRTFTKFAILSVNAFCIQILIELNYIEREGFIQQTATFIALSVLGFIFLNPILQKKYIDHASTAQNPVGDTAIVLNEPITKTSFGTISWHGFEKKATLDPSQNIDRVDIGQEVIVTHIDGDIFTVKPVMESVINDES